MTPMQISSIGNKLVKKCGTRDPFSIAECLGVTVLFCDNFGSLKGMYRVIKRNRFIFINKDLDEQMQRIVCAHELGHDQLHRQLADGNAIQEFMLYDMHSRPEYEANIIASEILLPDEDVLKLIYEYHFGAEEIAQTLHSDINLVALKCDTLSQKGYNLQRLDHKSDF